MAKPRKDDYLLMRDTYQGSRTGESCLIIGGGLSAERWEEIRDKVKPDALMGVNGVVMPLGDILDYWLSVEVEAYRAKWIDDRRPKHCFIHHLAASQPMANIAPGFVKIDRVHQHPGTYLRDYGRGLMFGDYRDNIGDHTGTVMYQALHLACIMGFWRVDTIGLDLCIKDIKGRHHWYDDQIPDYKLRHFHSYRGVYTQPKLIETARFFKEIVQDWTAYEGVKWVDHSDGLIQMLSPEDWSGITVSNGPYATPEIRLKMAREKVGVSA